MEMLIGKKERPHRGRCRLNQREKPSREISVTPVCDGEITRAAFGRSYNSGHVITRLVRTSGEVMLFNMKSMLNRRSERRFARGPDSGHVVRSRGALEW